MAAAALLASLIAAVIVATPAPAGATPRPPHLPPIT